MMANDVPDLVSTRTWCFKFLSFHSPLMSKDAGLPLKLQLQPTTVSLILPPCLINEGNSFQYISHISIGIGLLLSFVPRSCGTCGLWHCEAAAASLCCPNNWDPRACFRGGFYDIHGIDFLLHGKSLENILFLLQRTTKY